MRNNQIKIYRNPYVGRRYVRITSKILSAARAAAMAGRQERSASHSWGQEWPRSEGLTQSFHRQCVCARGGVGGRDVRL